MNTSHGLEIRHELVHCTELVIVCCHATYTGDGSDTGEDQWVLQDFQRSNPDTGRPSEHETYEAHILAGALAVEDRQQAMLMFSGGMTDKSTFTEAEGYEKVFKALASRGRVSGAYSSHRYELENWATDSFQNLLFSILRFRQVTGNYPRAVTVITHAFKEDRFLDLHAPAIKWPASRIRVQGLNPPFTRDELRATQNSELERAFDLFASDPYGVQPSLDSKRRARNWDYHHLKAVASEVEDEVGELLVWDGGKTGREFFPKKLPWEDDEKGTE